MRIETRINVLKVATNDAIERDGVLSRLQPSIVMMDGATAPTTARRAQPYCRQLVVHKLRPLGPIINHHRQVDDGEESCYDERHVEQDAYRARLDRLSTYHF